MTEPLTDSQLVAQTLENPDAYAGIIDRFESPLRRYISRMTGAPDEDIQELLQIVFIRAYRSLNSFHTRLKFSSWIYRIAHNACVDHLRKNGRKNQVSLDAEDDSSRSLLEALVWSDDVANTLITTEQKTAIYSIFAQMDDTYRTVMLLFFTEEKSYSEISDILRIPVSTVGTLLRRAKQQFFTLSQEPRFHHIFPYVHA